MKHLFSILILLLNLNLTAQDTTRIYLDAEFSKIKAKKASYVQKLWAGPQGLWHSEIRDVFGTLKEKGFYTLENKNYVKHGAFEAYDFYGALHETGNYVDDVRVGTWITYYRTGEKESFGVYNTQGKKDSTWIWRHENGKLLTQGKFVNGHKVGEWRSFYEDGDKNAIKLFNEEGELDGAYMSFGTLGFPYDKGSYQNGNKIGEWNYYFNSGEACGKVTYENNEPVKSTYWDENGMEVNLKKKVVNHYPSFVGGDKKMYAFLGKQMRYPPTAQDNNIQGRVYVSFVVEKNGKISDIRILKSPHPELSKETLRVVRKMPRWEPGIDQNRKVRVRFNLPIVFKLQ